MSERQERLPVDAWMPLFVGDWLTGTATFVMNNRQRGAFVQLLCHAWKQKASLPDDVRTIAKYADEPADWFDTPEGSEVLGQFPVGADGRRRNPKQAETFERATSLREEKARKAKIAAEARWGRGGSDDPDGEQSDSGGNAGASGLNANASTQDAGAYPDAKRTVCPPPSSSPSQEKAVVEAALAAALERYPQVVGWIGSDESRRANVADGAARVAGADGPRAIVGWIATVQATVQEHRPEVIDRGLIAWLTRADSFTPNSFRVFVASANRNARTLTAIETAGPRSRTTTTRAENPGRSSKLLDA